MVATSHTHRFIYIKTMKTGGTSIEMYLEPLCTPSGHIVQHQTPTIISEYGIVGRRDAVPPKFNPRLYRYFKRYQKWYNHMSTERIRCRIGPETFDSYMKISSIWKPFDHAISFYHQFKLVTRQNVPVDAQERRRDFQKFIGGRWTNQKHLLTVDGKICVQRFVRLEHAHDDLSSIVAEIGANPARLTLFHAKKNNTRSRDLTDYYDRRTAEKVRDHMGWVFDRFDYSTEILGL